MIINVKSQSPQIPPYNARIAYSIGSDVTGTQEKDVRQDPTARIFVLGNENRVQLHDYYYPCGLRFQINSQRSLARDNSIDREPILTFQDKTCSLRSNDTARIFGRSNTFRLYA